MNRLETLSEIRPFHSAKSGGFLDAAPRAVLASGAESGSSEER